MDILFYDSLKGGSLDGRTVHIYELVNGLSKLGHNVVLLNSDFPSDETEVGATRQLSTWTRIKHGVSRSRILKPIIGEIALLWLSLKEIHTFILALIIVARRREKFDVVYARHCLLNSAYPLARLFRIPLVGEVNGIIVDERRINREADNFSLWVIDRLERFSMPRADKIIVVPPGLEEILQQDYGVPGDKITAILNGANTDLFKPMDVMKAREELGLAQNRNYICFVGSLWRSQGVEYLLGSIPLILEQCPETLFLIVGDGSMKQELIELAERIGVSASVIFTGTVPYQEVPTYINASDVCVAPFVRERNERIGVSPLKLCEYLACQRPVITSRLGGLEIVEENAAGSLVEPDSSSELATAIIKLLQNQELRNQMGENGRRYVLENQSWESVAKRVAEVCQGLIDGRRHKGKGCKK